MESRMIAMVVVGIVVMSSAAIIAVELLKDGTDYNITYVLYDGVNSERNPEKYKGGAEYDLYAAEKNGFVFIGWFLDEDFDEEITTISKDMRGDITLYACWEESQVGMCFTYDIEGSNTRYTGPFRSETPISGTITYTFLTYRYGRGYYIGYDQTVTTGSGRFATVNNHSEKYWSGESETVWTRGEDKVIDTINGSKECSTWINMTRTSTETQYVGLDDDITYLMIYEETENRNTYSVTYTLMETHRTVIDDQFTVEVYCDKGISVTGDGVFDAYTSVTLTASGQSFSGWYSPSGDLLSDSITYEMDILLSDMVVYARNSNDSDLSFNSTTITATPDVALTDVTWKIDDNGNEITRTGSTLNYTYSSAGSYIILYTGTDSDGNTYHGLYDLFADGLVSRTYSWNYDDHNYTAGLDILYSDYLAYRNDIVKRSQGSTAHDVSFVTYQDPYIINLMDQIQSQCIGKSDAYTANVILAFTQYIEYQYDSDSVGQDEYWRYPLETLFDENGDCEDTSILFCALAKAGGYDCALILYSGHMAAGIHIDGVSYSGYYDYNNVRYYYSETTSTGWSVGDAPDKSLRMQKVMPVP